jgi:NitT/TauT family transport system substrate-binding protein
VVADSQSKENDMLRRTFTRGAVAAAALAAAGPVAAQSKDKVTLLLNWYLYSEHAPFFLGRERGFFDQEGIDLDIQEGRGAGVTVQAVAAGSAQFGYADVATMIKAAAKGAPVISVGVLLQTSPMAIMGFADKGVKTLQDVKGKTVVLTPGDSMSQVWPLLMQKNGLKPEDVKVLSGDAQTKLNAVISGQADVTMGYVMDQAVKLVDATKRPVQSIRFADYGVNLVCSGVIVKKDLLKSNPELVKRFMRAATKSMEAAVAEPDAAVAAMLKASPKSGFQDSMTVGLKQATALYKAPGETAGRPYRVSSKTMNESFQMLLDYGGVDKATAGSATNYYTNDYLP